MKLEFGCGESPRKDKEGFLGVDIRSLPTVRYVCDAWNITKHVPYNTVTNIYSRHFLEHLTFAQLDLTLDAWNKIMVKDGEMELLVPDMRYHIDQWLNPNRHEIATDNKLNHTYEERAKRGFWGHQTDGETELWDVHKSGYDFELMSKYLTKHGFKDIVRVDNRPWHLHMKCIKG